MRIMVFFALMVSFIPAASAQADFDRGTGDIKAALSGIDAPQVPAPAPDKGWFSGNNDPKPQALKEWTVMVYMNGKNDLEGASFEVLYAIELSGSSDKVNVVAEWGRMNGQPKDSDADGNWTGSRRYYIKRNSNENRLKSKPVQEFKTVDMGDWRHLVDFARWGRENYPARKYLLVVWNHGSGWKTTKAVNRTKGISYDYGSKNHISTPELGLAMKEIGRVDILAFDACLMQMAEVLYEIKDYAEVVVGSEEIEYGYRYDFLDTLLNEPGMDAERLSREMVAVYERFYSLKDNKTTLSAVRASALPAFTALFNGWTDALLSSDRSRREIKRTALLTEHYNDIGYRDLYSVAAAVAELEPAGPLGVKGRALMEFMASRLVIANTAHKGISARDGNSHGLAVYLPYSGYSDKYDALAWARDTRWDEFLKGIRNIKPGDDIVVCRDPGPGATISQLKAHISCLEQDINRGESR